MHPEDEFTEEEMMSRNPYHLVEEDPVGMNFELDLEPESRGPSAAELVEEDPYRPESDKFDIDDSNDPFMDNKSEREKS